jgi:OmcA/MtrC family decaheme c-type cytochrome
MNICVFCHVPNLSSSGRTVDPATASTEVVAAYGPNPLLYPEATNNFKDMIHGIHGGEVRTTDYEFVRNRNDGIPYNWSEVVFPQSASNCLACHIDNPSFTPPLDEDTLLTTNVIPGVMEQTLVAISAARDSVPNATDIVITPTAAACYACHDSEAVQAHMEGNGALINANRSFVLGLNSVETCTICHGSGKSADVVVAHRAVEPTVLGVIKAPPEEDGGDSGGGGGQTQVDLCGPGPISSQPGGHTTRLDCCSCHGFN